MITVINYDKENMKIEKVNSVITSLMEQSDLKYIDFDIYDSESIDSLNAFYTNITNINTKVAIILRVQIDFRDITSMRMFDDVLRQLDDLDCNIFVLKYYDDLKHLSFKSDYIMNIITLINEHDDYVINITKSLENLHDGFSINFKFDNRGLIYFHPIYQDTMDNIQKFIFKKSSVSYHEDNISRDLYLENKSNIADCELEDIFKDMPKPEVFMSGKNIDNRIDSNEYNIESLDNAIFDSVSNILDTFFKEKNKFEDDINGAQTERLIIKINGEEV